MRPEPDADVRRVAARRLEAGVRTAAIVPALDEEATIAAVVTTLVGMTGPDGLLDEVVVVDGGSSDATARLAAQAGARIESQPSSPVPPGKGAAMRLGLDRTVADLVVFLDADLIDMPPSWPALLLEPLLDDARLAIVKAAYRRPLGEAPTGGGRVTELLARPLLATYWPELRLEQPLAGEYAVRRRALAELPFVAGYGVELAMLVDVVHRDGPVAIGEVDLGVRHHVHQPLEALGRMAAEVLAVGVSRAAAQGRDPAPSPVLAQPFVDAEGRRAQVEHLVTWQEVHPTTQ